MYFILKVRAYFHTFKTLNRAGMRRCATARVNALKDVDKGRAQAYRLIAS